MDKEERMLIQDFHNWLNELEEGDIEAFKIFYRETRNPMYISESIEELAWEVYQLQECMEGILSDLEYER
jgi:hypothetical protein